MKDLKQLFEESGLTLSEISKISGIRKEYLIKLEEGSAKAPRINHSFYIAKAIKKPIYEVQEAILESMKK